MGVSGDNSVAKSPPKSSEAVEKRLRFLDE